MVPIAVTSAVELALCGFASVPADLPAAVLSLGDDESVLAQRNSQVHQELTVRATLDGLTGLANRTSFNIALSAALDDESDRPTTRPVRRPR